VPALGAARNQLASGPTSPELRLRRKTMSATSDFHSGAEPKRTDSPLTPTLAPLRGEGARRAVLSDRTSLAALGAWVSVRRQNAAQAASLLDTSTATPSPLNGERAGVRGEDADWLSLLSHVARAIARLAAAKPRQEGSSDFHSGSETKRTDSPLPPLRGEGARRAVPSDRTSVAALGACAFPLPL